MTLSQLLNIATKNGNMTSVVQSKIYAVLTGSEFIEDPLGDLILDALEEARRYSHLQTMPGSIALDVFNAVQGGRKRSS